MALDSDALKTSLKSALEGFFGTALDATQLENFCEAIAVTVLGHIAANAEVTTTGTATVIGGSSAGPHETASTGTIS